MNPPIGLFYGSSTCYTEIAAEKIVELLGADIVKLHNIIDTPIAEMASYSKLILGIPTWDYGELQEDWENCWDDLDSLDLNGTSIAIYGLGDQQGYPEWFQDALGYLCAKVESLGAKTIGYWPTEGYNFIESQGLTADKQYFVGLALDEDSQYELSEPRLESWCQQLKTEFGLK